MTEVPVVVTKEAAGHVVRSDLQKELEQNLDWVRSHVISLLGIRVEMSGRDRPPELPPLVYIRAYQGPPAANAPPDLVEMDWVAWLFDAIPPRARIAFILICQYEPFVRDEAA
jgi:hypothetical protein